MRLAEQAWSNTDTTVIRNCWRKSGILPNSEPGSPPSTQPSLPISALVHADSEPTLSPNTAPVNPVAAVEKVVESALDDLQSTGVLHPSNRMSIEDLLNPTVEAHKVSNGTDEDIYQAVMDAKTAREVMEAGPGTGAGLGAVDLEPAPTRTEALQAVMLLQRYTGAIDGPFARKVEAVLGSFGRETRREAMKSLKETKLTTYFRPKDS